MKKRESQTGPLLGQTQRQHVIRYWVWELLALLLTVTCLVVIVIVLSRYNNKKMSELPSSINLTMAIAFLTGVLRTAVAIVLAEIISQAKWLWFAKRPRHVMEFQTFDHASRGPVGSLKLTSLLRFGFRGSPLAFIAAVTTILTLAIEPFAQQAIKTETCSRISPNSVASLPMAHAVPGVDGLHQEKDGNWEIGMGIKNALVNGLTNPLGSSAGIQATCPTGNCTFGNRDGISESTIGMCSKCFDATKLTKSTSTQDIANSVNLTLDELWISLGTGLPWLAAGSIDLASAQSGVPQDLKDVAVQSFVNISVLMASRSPCGDKDGKCPHLVAPKDSSYPGVDYIAATCALYPCLKEISSQVEDGGLKETVLSTVPAQVTEGKFQGNSVNLNDARFAVKSPCIVNGQVYDVGNFSVVTDNTTEPVVQNIKVDGKQINVPSECYYQIDGIYTRAMQQYLESNFLNGQCFQRNEVSGNNTEDLNCGNGWWLQSLYGSGNATFTSVDKSFDNLATSITNFFRMDGLGPVSDPNIQNGQIQHNAANVAQVNGDVFESTLCLKVNWLWLLLPGIVCFNTIVLLTLMLIISYMNRNQYVWKSSQLPLLFFGLDARAEQSTPGSRGGNDLGSLEKASKKIKITLGSLDYDPSQSRLVPKESLESEEYEGGVKPPPAASRLTTESLYERIYAPRVAQEEARRGGQTRVPTIVAESVPANVAASEPDSQDDSREEHRRDEPFVVSPPSSPY